jgi:DNA-directed RNA polymerase specialized sigma24 family protein
LARLAAHPSPKTRGFGGRNTIASANELDALQPALNTLPLAQRAVFLLHRVDALDFAQVAWRLGLRKDAVEQHFADAILQLTFGADADGGGSSKITCLGAKGRDLSP